MELMESWWTGGSAELGIQGVAGAGGGGRWLGLSVGVFGTLVMHSPKVPHPDFSVQVVRHNLKIFCCGKLLRRGNPPRFARRGGRRRPPYTYTTLRVSLEADVRECCSFAPPGLVTFFGLGTHGLRHGLYSFAASRLVPEPLLLRPSGLVTFLDLAPTAYAVGCILTPLRGWIPEHLPSPNTSTGPRRVRKRASGAEARANGRFVGTT